MGESFGVLVDAIGDVAKADETRIENMGDQGLEVAKEKSGELSDLIVGNCKLDDRIMIVLASDLLLARIREIHKGNA